METTEIITVSEARVSCDGGKGALGHPKVYLDVKKKGYVDCPYCSRRFVLEKQGVR